MGHPFLTFSEFIVEVRQGPWQYKPVNNVGLRPVKAGPLCYTSVGQSGPSQYRQNSVNSVQFGENPSLITPVWTLFAADSQKV